jgi:hypothetical protein
MPIRSYQDGQFVGAYINRTLHFGDVLSIFMTEGRLTGARRRTKSAAAHQRVCATAACASDPRLRARTCAARAALPWGARLAEDGDARRYKGHA